MPNLISYSCIIAEISEFKQTANSIRLACNIYLHKPNIPILIAEEYKLFFLRHSHGNESGGIAQ